MRRPGGAARCRRTSARGGARWPARERWGSRYRASAVLRPRWPARERWEKGHKARPQWSGSFAAREGRARRPWRRCQRGPAQPYRQWPCRRTAGKEIRKQARSRTKIKIKTRAQEKVNRVFLKPRPGEDGPAAAAQSTGRKGTQAASAHHPRTKLQHGRRRRAPCTVDAHAGQACQVCRDRDVREALSVTCHAARRTPCGQRRARSSNRGLVGRGVAGTAQSAGLTRARLRCVLFRLLWLFVIP